MVWRGLFHRVLPGFLAASVAFGGTGRASAATCEMAFAVTVIQGVGMIPPGTILPGQAKFTSDGRSFRQEGGAVGHMMQGQMQLGGLAQGVRGDIWIMVATAHGHAAEMVALYARDVEGLSFAGLRFEGPMTLSLFGDPGTRTEPIPPQSQAEWDALNLRRSFALHAQGIDMLSGTVEDLRVTCEG